MRTLLALVLFLFAVAAVDGLELGSRLLDYVEREFGEAARGRLENWQALVAEHRESPEPLQLEAVNRFFNKRDFRSDLAHWGESDYWATPVEFLATDAGDCEEYANSKYMTLRALGVPDERMRITYVDARQLNQAHMVLAYYPEPGAEPLILDNLVDSIQPASQRQDLEPVYSFNGSDLWLSREAREDRRIGSADDVAEWRRLRDRMINITD
ncbi:putative transglutaminase-like cysteine proteinase [Halospina denitrificans]|uniref:Putative transglutaminase-like cysteine proteinase n=1 Tax=Halospina denitrificans TaxID=332522 RepID=A0A4V3EQI1_9GAMM|nr:transglutaminase-like cysteine peptidase [Halospina denitrificans]TDT41378.1 putative transglutaminase-like cysteine proteinase [Halospina denitrificans]